jgi:uncharacterized protein YqeY
VRDPDLRQTLRAALRTAMKARDETATSALRSALSAIDNAEAVEAPTPPTAGSGPIAGAVDGVGAGEAPRRALSAVEVVAIVQSDIDERVAAAGEYDDLGRMEEAARLRAEAAVLTAFL